jgi:hypothetical protein
MKVFISQKTSPTTQEEIDILKEVSKAHEIDSSVFEGIPDFLNDVLKNNKETKNKYEETETKT